MDSWAIYKTLVSKYASGVKDNTTIQAAKRMIYLFNMSSTNFFLQAPTQDTYQKRFLEAIMQKQHVIVNFPLGYPMVSLYALPVFMSDGLAIVICPNSAQIHRNLEYFQQAGMKFPDVAYLDGTQMPHEERMIHKEINHHRVRLLYVTPDRFVSLTFLEILVHQPIQFLAIEEADRFLPELPGYGLYQKLLDQGLMQLNKLPPLALMIPPVSQGRLRALSQLFKLESYQLIECPPRLDVVELKVKRLFSEHQKFSGLVGFLSGKSNGNKMGRLDEPGATLIQATFPAQAEKLGASLLDYGFESVSVSHFKKSGKEQSKAITIANAKAHHILVNAGGDVRYWSPPAGLEAKVVYWSPPLSMDAMLIQMLRQPTGQRGAEISRLRARVYHTREDFLAAVRRFKSERVIDIPATGDRLQALRLYREWVLSEDCRLRSLEYYLYGAQRVSMESCGRCDRCTEAHNARWKMQRFLQNWLY